MGTAELKIFGERNTGTNALKTLIESNSGSRISPSVAKEFDRHYDLKMRLFRRLPRRYGMSLAEAYIDGVFKRRSPRHAWKHAATRFDDIGCFEGCPVILTIRNPISWVHGLHRHPHNALAPVPADFSQFLQTDWRLVRRDNLDAVKLTPVEMWNRKAQSFVAFQDALAQRNLAAMLVKFEEFVADQEGVFAQLKHLLAAPVERPKIVQGSTKDKSKDHRYYRDYYGQQKWLAEIDPGAAKAASQGIDWGLAASFGYERPAL